MKYLINLFQIHGEEYVKPLPPNAIDFILGEMNKFLLEEGKLLAVIYGKRSSYRYSGACPFKYLKTCNTILKFFDRYIRITPFKTGVKRLG